MLPVHIDYPYERPPWATIGLMAINALVFLWASTATEQELRALVLQSDDVSLWTLVTSCFLHIGAGHLIGNLLFLFVFGRYVEARVGWARMLAIYLASGLAGDLAFLVVSAAYDAPRGVLGASGAIAGLMGWTLIAAPKADIRLWVVWWYHARGRGLPAVSAWFVLGGWILWQLTLWVFAGRVLGTAFSAHFGGLLAGGGIAWWMHNRVPEGTFWHVEQAAGGGSLEEARLERTARKWKQRAEDRRAAEAARGTAERDLAERAAARRVADEPIAWPPPPSDASDARYDRPPTSPPPPAEDDAIDWPLSDTGA